MGRKLPTPVSLLRVAQLCLLALVNPAKFAAVELEDNAKLNSSPNAPPIEQVLLVRRALGESLLYVLISGAAGFVAGYVLSLSVGPASARTIAVLQVVGALVLLWATLAVRGWDVQTFVAVTLTERVNQWIYRFLYCAGTALLVLSLAWQLPAVGGSYPLSDGGRVLEYSNQRDIQIGGYTTTVPQTTYNSGTANVYGTGGSAYGTYSGTSANDARAKHRDAVRDSIHDQLTGNNHKMACQGNDCTAREPN